MGERPLVNTTIFGIANCDTVRKARDWLVGHGIAYRFHDYRKSGIDQATLAGWVDQLGWEVVLNRAGTTFRKLPETERSHLDGNKAIALMLGQPAMIKRPVAVHPGGLLVGFKPDEWAKAYQQ